MKRLWLAPAIVFAAAVSIGLAQTPGVAGPDEEARLIQLLQSRAGPGEVNAACVRLHRIGTERAIPALAALLADPRTSHAARYALEAMPSPAAGRALVEALERTTGGERLGIIGSLAVRRERIAVASLARLLVNARSSGSSTTGGAPPGEAVAAAEALGEIDAPDAIAALEQAWRETGGAVQRAVADALLRQANARLAADDRSEARRLFVQVRERTTDERLRLASFQGVIRSLGDDGLRLLVDALAGSSRSEQQAALGLVPELPVAGATDAFAKVLPNLPPPTQVALLGAWMQRPEPPPLSTLAPFLGSESADVRLSAIRALGRVGDASVVAPLMKTAALRGPEQDAARLALTEMTAADVPVTLLTYLDSPEPDTFFEAARILAERGEKRALAPLLQRASDESPRHRQGALRALVVLLDEPRFGDLVRLVVNARDDAARAEAARAVAIAYERVAPAPSRESLQPLLHELNHGTPAIRVALLPATRPLPQPAIRAAVRAAIADRNAEVRAAGIRAASRSMDAELLPDLTAIANGAAEDEVRDVATKACLRFLLADGNVVPVSTRIELLGGFAGRATSPAQKRALLSALTRGQTVAELELTRSLIADAPLRAEATDALLAIASRVGESGPVLEILRRVRKTVTDSESGKRLDAALKQITARAGFVTSWRSAEFARVISRWAPPLIDTRFTPEEKLGDFSAGATRMRLANWQPMAAGTNVTRPRQLRGGGPTNFSATYAYTRLQAARAQPAELLIEHDAPIKLWLNGEPVPLEPEAERSRRASGDRAKVSLRPGANVLLLKIAEPGRAWSFSVRLVNPDGSPLSGVVADASIDLDR